jgi:hypothetical protein
LPVELVVASRACGCQQGSWLPVGLVVASGAHDSLATVVRARAGGLVTLIENYLPIGSLEQVARNTGDLFVQIYN